MTENRTVTTIPGDPSGAGSGCACIVQIYGGELGRRYPIQSELTMGRDEDNGVLLDLPSVSRHHARLFVAAKTCRVEDLGSTNGTYVNDREITAPTELRNGDLLKLGGAVFKFIEGGNIEALYHEEIYRLTITDGLTRIHNRRYLMDFLDREIARASRHERPLSLAMLDIDNFKSLNDTYGHLTGDFVLHELAQLLSRRMRREALLARYGGEEFVMVLPETDAEGARLFSDNVRRIVEEHPFIFDGEELRITVSIGVATMNDRLEIDEFIKAADEQLLQAKRAGRNRVHAA